MIDIHIKVLNDQVADHLNDLECDLGEVSLALYRLKQIEQRLIDKQFESNFEVKE